MPAEDTAYLALYLDAPLQSWGYQSRFDRRTTLPYPTRSGIVGMVCAAMGVARDDTRQLSRLETLRMTILTFRQEPVLVDFHTVGGGYDDKRERHSIPCSPSHKPHRVVTHREYLQHSRFGAVLTGPKEVVQEAADALRDPTWGIWLGRKACVPASPVCQGLFDSYEAAVSQLESRTECSAVRVVTEVDEFGEGTDTVMDRPLDFHRRLFAPRRVKVEP